MWNWIKDLFKPQPKKPTDSDVVTYPPWYRIALLELGQKEVSGSKSNPKIIEYHKQTSLKAKDDETPWCASFVNWCLGRAGIKGNNSARAKDFLKWGTAGTGEIGDIAVFNRDGGGHVGFVAEKREHGSGSIRILGGNQSNQVKVSSYSLKDLLGYRRPS